MKALEFSNKELRYAAAAISSRIKTGSGAKLAPLSLNETDTPELPAEGWQSVRTLLAGICGSDLATVEGKSSRYFEPWVSFPFTPGHEILGKLNDGSRVVIEPVMGHESRGFKPPFEGAAPGDGDDYSHIVSGDLEPGIQIGFCASTGGGWSEEFAAHQSQIRPVNEKTTDEAAVMIEPAAVGVHAAFKANVTPGATVVVMGSGTMGLVTIAALRTFTEAGKIIASAKYPEQAEHAKSLGADIVAKPAELTRAVRRETNSFIIGNDLSSGADVVIDAVGSSNSIQEAIGICKPKGRVVLLGMPGKTSLDFTSLWHREVELVGAYTYGTEVMPDGEKVRTFDLSAKLVDSSDLGSLVSALYPLEDYKEALDHAANAGKRGATKICFDLRN